MPFHWQCWKKRPKSWYVHSIVYKVYVAFHRQWQCWGKGQQVSSRVVTYASTQARTDLPWQQQKRAGSSYVSGCNCVNVSVRVNACDPRECVCVCVLRQFAALWATVTTGEFFIFIVIVTIIITKTLSLRSPNWTPRSLHTDCTPMNFRLAVTGNSSSRNTWGFFPFFLIHYGSRRMNAPLNVIKQLVLCVCLCFGVLPETVI